MSIIIFIIILGLLVLVHELGHFVFAKKAGVRVDEFGFGYPPRAIILGERWGTKFSLNWVPFGGFVKMLGENYEEQESETERLSRVRKFSAENLLSARSVESRKPLENSFGFRFTEVSKKWQAGILFAGVLFNFIFAWFLFSIGFMVGMPTPNQNDFGYEVQNPALTVTSVLQDSPAEIVGLRSGDKIISVDGNGKSLNPLNPEKVSDFVNTSVGTISVGIDRGGKILNFDLLPKTGLGGEETKDRKIIGINMDVVGVLRLPIHRSLIEGAKITGEISYLTAKGIIGLIGGAFKGEADLSQVAGPIGIVGLVGDASRLGIIYLLSFTALISINLAVINLLPIPALDGGRLLFVAIEAITKRPINAKFAHTLNSVSFALLIILMLFITYRDISKLF